MSWWEKLFSFPTLLSLRLHSLFLPCSPFVVVNKPLHHVTPPPHPSLMTGMVGGLHKGPPSCEGGLRMVLIVGVRIGGSFVAVFQGLFGASHPENQRCGAVNSFSPGPLWSSGFWYQTRSWTRGPPPTRHLYCSGLAPSVSS